MEVITIKTVKKTIGNVTIDIYNEGEYKIDGKVIPHGAEIKIRAGKSALKLGAREMLSLKALLEDAKVREVLQERYDEEELLLSGMEF